MTTINRSALVAHSAAEMFNLVDDIDRYPEFLPWCRTATVHSRDEDEVRATLDLAKGGVQKTFTTVNRRQPGKMMEMRLLEGPFHHLEGFWRFDELSDSACKVSLDLEFEFNSKVVGMVFGPVFNQVANTLVDCFCKRADEVYGKS